jgi:hypothetical protein
MTSVNQQDEENLSAEVDHLLEEGLTRKDIEARGYSPSLVRQRIRKRVKAGKGAPNPSGRNGLLAIRKEREVILPEWVAAQLDLFDGSERDKRIYMSGLATPLLGMRLFCEAIKPFTDLLTCWQKGQAEAMRVADQSGLEMAREAADQAAISVGKYFDEKKPWLAASPNPLMAVMVDAMRPALTNIMGKFMPGAQATEQANPPGFTIEKKKREE